MVDFIHNLGYQIIANRLSGQSTYASTTLQFFAWSNGTTDPTLTDTAATFYADGSAWDTKGVESYDWDVANKRATWNCYVSPLENTVASITKFALGNADPITTMFCSHKFGALSKDNSKSYYLRFRLTMSQV